MLQTASIQVKIDPKTKATATALYQEMGLTLSDAIKLFLKQSINQRRMPFTPSTTADFDPASFLDLSDIAKGLREAGGGRDFATDEEYQDWYAALKKRVRAKKTNKKA